MFMKDLKQLKASLTVCESVSSTVQYQVTGGKCEAQSDDKRRDRPGSNSGNRNEKDPKKGHQCDAQTKG